MSDSSRPAMIESLLANIPGEAYRCRNDPDWTVEYVSEGVRELTGYGPEDFLLQARGYGHLILPEDRDRVWQETQVALGARRAFSIEYRIRTRSGEIRWVRDRGRGVYGAGGEATHTEGFVGDITQRVLSTQLARDADERLRQAIEHLAEAIAVTDAEDRIVVSNKAFRELNRNIPEAEPGHRYEDHLRRGFVMGHFPEATGREEAWLAERLARRRRGGMSELSRQDGRWLRITDQPLPEGGVITFGLDITERKRAEEALQAGQRLLERVIDAVPMSIFAKDLDSNYVMVNQYMADFFGTTKEGLLRHHTSELPSRDATREQSLRDDRWVFENRRTLVHETWIQSPDGTPVPFHSSKIPLFDADGSLAGLLGVNRDISIEREAQRRIEEANATLETRVRERTAQLEAANRELEAFSYSVSHDLKAPLRAIDGAVGILRMDFGDTLPPGAQEFLDRVSRSARQAGMLIEGLLEFARLSRQALEQRVVDTGEVVRQVLAGRDDAVRATGAKVRVGELPACRADPVLLAQVFDNLIGNALKYSAQSSPPRIEVGALDEAGKPVFWVRDNGVGFDMAYAGKLFGVFQRLHAPTQFEGTGIGLALARRIVERHGGRIWAEANPGRGAVFRFTLGA